MKYNYEPSSDLLLSKNEIQGEKKEKNTGKNTGLFKA